jgi:N-acetylmuramoyl-L-alanine amidase
VKDTLSLLMKKRGTAAIVFLVITAVLSIFLANLSPAEKSATMTGTERPVLVIDAGHGGIDAGVVGKTTGVKESDLNLAISKKLSVELIESGFKTVLTRSSTAGLYGTATSNRKRKEMQKRKEIINRENPDAVISVHLNYYPSSSRRGAQAFYSEDSEEGKNFAQIIQNGLNELPTNEREYLSLKGDYYLLKCSKAPSVIIECGFLSNPEDESYLIDEEYQRALAKNIALSVAEYFLTATNS